jgi:hypothetical protein
MARGWESKGVADQIEEADRSSQGKVEETGDSMKHITSAQVESLRMSRARVLEQLEHATKTAHRAMLNRALSAIEKEISELPVVPKK